MIIAVWFTQVKGDHCCVVTQVKGDHCCVVAQVKGDHGYEITQKSKVIIAMLLHTSQR